MTNLIGILGALILLVAFTLNQIEIIGRDSVTYDGLNMIGGLLMTWYAYLIGSYPFLVLNLVWAFMALKDLVSYYNSVNFH